MEQQVHSLNSMFSSLSLSDDEIRVEGFVGVGRRESVRSWLWENGMAKKRINCRKSSGNPVPTKYAYASGTDQVRLRQRSTLTPAYRPSTLMPAVPTAYACGTDSLLTKLIKCNTIQLGIL